MGKINVTGHVSGRYDYDSMRISLTFCAQESTSALASEKVMRDGELFLKNLKSAGIDTSIISLDSDCVEHTLKYVNNEAVDSYTAKRVFRFESVFDTKIINTIHEMTEKSEYEVGFRMEYILSNEDELRQKLFMEAVKDAKRQAELMAESIGHKIVSLISADANDPSLGALIETKSGGESDCLCAELVTEEKIYPESEKLSALYVTLHENAFTVWEICREEEDPLVSKLF